MIELVDLVRPAVENLLQSEESQLYEELGVRQKAIMIDPAKAGFFEPDLTYDAEEMGSLDDLRDFGRILFEKLNVDAYNLVCGTKTEDSEERRKLLAAFGIDDKVVAAAIAALLITHMAIAPAIAAVVAAIIVKLFFQNTHRAMCEVWKKKLPSEH